MELLILLLVLLLEAREEAEEVFIVKSGDCAFCNWY